MADCYAAVVHTDSDQGEVMRKREAIAKTRKKWKRLKRSIDLSATEERDFRYYVVALWPHAANVR